MEIFNWLIGNKIKTYLHLGVLVVIGGYIAFHLVNYKNSIRDAKCFKTERDRVIQQYGTKGNIQSLDEDRPNNGPR